MENMVSMRLKDYNPGPSNIPITMCNFGAKNKEKTFHPDATTMQYIQLVGPVFSYKRNVKN
jgi:hypothetical protein